MGQRRGMAARHDDRMGAPHLSGAPKAPAVLDGQTRPSFIAEACELIGADSRHIILITCAADVRRARLLKRGQPELANDQMMQWARYLAAETTRIGGTIIDNDNLSVAETASALAQIVGQDTKAGGDGA